MFLALFVTTGVTGFSGTAHACSCVRISQEEGFKNSEAVFSGTVLGVTLEKDLSEAVLGGSVSYKEVRVQVDEVWKGVNDAVVSVGTAQYSASCGYDFEVGGTYLIYARSGEYYGTDYSSGICSRTSVLASDRAQSDLEFLGEAETEDSREGDTPTSTSTSDKGGESTQETPQEKQSFVAQVITIIKEAFEKLISTIVEAL